MSSQTETEVKIFTGGLYRCCVESLLDEEIRNQPVGTVVDCNHCTGQMIRRSDGWHGYQGPRFGQEN